MTKTIVALYDDFPTAERVIENLTEAGFAREDISVMANDATGEYSNHLSGDRDIVINEDVSAGEGAGFGAVVGGLIGLGVSLIPGIGPVIGAGPLAVALTTGIGAAAGAITGGVTAGLIDMGVDEDDADAYAEGVRRGGTLISLTTNEEWAERAEQIMNRYNPVDIDSRTSVWRESGWSRFDHNAQPYSAAQIESERLSYTNYTSPTGGMGSTMEEDLYSDEDRLNSLEPTHTDESSSGHWAANQATRGQQDYAARSSGMIDSDLGAPKAKDVEAGAIPSGAERHHETSHAVDQAMDRDTSGEVEIDRNARIYSRTGGKQDTNPTDANNLNR